MNLDNMAWRWLAAALVSAVVAGAAQAAPGAHGPDGEHLDGPAQGYAAQASPVPRFESATEAFELVGQLRPEGLVLFFNHFTSGKPVEAAEVEVELVVSGGSGGSGGPQAHKAMASWRADLGDYLLAEPALVQALGRLGSHTLLISLLSADDADLLEAELLVDAESAAALASAAAGAGLTLAALRTPGRLPDGSVLVPMAAQRRLEIETLAARSEAVAATVVLSGTVVMDPNAGGRVQTAIGGRIEAGPRGLPVVGQTVARGEVLATVAHTPDPVVQANQAALLAEVRSQRRLAAERLRRLQALEGTVPRKEIDAARAAGQSLAARERALVSAVAPRETLAAPLAGVITHADVLVGEIVQPRDRLFEIVDPARLLVEAVVADGRLVDALGDASLAHFPGVELRYIGAARTLRDGVLPVLFRVNGDAAGSGLAIGQPVTVLARRKASITGFVLPARAVTRNTANEAVIWIKAGAERYLPQPVQYQPLDASTVVVTRGLGADNRVVIDGASLLAQVRQGRAGER